MDNKKLNEHIRKTVKKVLKEYWSLDNLKQRHGFLGYEKNDVHNERVAAEDKHSQLIQSLSSVADTSIDKYGNVRIQFYGNNNDFNEVVSIVKQNGYKYSVNSIKQSGYNVNDYDIYAYGK